MHERLMRAVEEGDIEVIDMWEEGDGPQHNAFVKRKVSKVFDGAPIRRAHGGASAFWVQAQH